MYRKYYPALLFIAVINTMPNSVFAQCDFGWKQFGELPGVLGTVNAMTVYDDGTGAALYVGGLFTVAGGKLASSIAKWDGNQWSAVGDTGIMNGAGGPGEVYALTVHNGKLIVAGNFSFAGVLLTPRIVSWNGTNWEPLGAGLPSTVHALTVFNGELIAGTDFLVRRWNGTSWSVLPGSPAERTNAFAVSGSTLYMGGVFTSAGVLPANYVVGWDGNTWHALGTGVNDEVLSLRMYNGELLVGGRFSQAGGVLALSFAKWNGSTWGAIAGNPSQGSWCYTISESDGDLIAVFGNRVYRWNPTTGWTSIGEVFNAQAQGQAVYCTAIFSGELFAGGSFTTGGCNASCANSIAASSIVRIASGTMQSVGIGSTVTSTVNALAAISESAMIVGGDFLAAGMHGASHVGMFEGNEWSRIGGGIADEVFAVGVFGGLHASGPDGWHRWDGVLGQWTTGMDGFTYAMQSFGGLVVGGSFAGKIKRNGTILGGGLGPDGPAREVFAIIPFMNGIAVGGDFSQAGGIPVSGIAFWDDVTWSALGSGINGTVTCLCLLDGELVAGGLFSTAGAVTVNNITRWDGTSWQPLGSGIDGPVYALAVHEGNLIAGGSFHNAGGIAARRIARWNGLTWESFGTGIGTQSPFTLSTATAVHTILEHSGDLIIGGNFDRAGSLASPFLIRWSRSCERGDVNCDQTIDTSDVFGLVSALIDSELTDPCTAYLSDMNADGQLNGSDVQGFVNVILGP